MPTQFYFLRVKGLGTLTKMVYRLTCTVSFASTMDRFGMAI